MRRIANKSKKDKIKNDVIVRYKLKVVSIEKKRRKVIGTAGPSNMRWDNCQENIPAEKGHYKKRGGKRKSKVKNMLKKRGEN